MTGQAPLRWAEQMPRRLMQWLIFWLSEQLKLMDFEIESVDGAESITANRNSRGIPSRCPVGYATLGEFCRSFRTVVVSLVGWPYCAQEPSGAQRSLEG